jgi:hypothetical protein
MSEEIEITEATEENWQALAHHIILQAVADYRRAVRKLMKELDHVDALADMLEVERFFHSEWFSVLTDLNGKLILARLKREIRNSEGNL